MANMTQPALSGSDLISCEICLEPFDSQCRQPKLLPCGHNFCENCLFSLCLHSEYYLLDTIKCPKCRNICESKLAMNAPTNFALCRLLENFKTQNNVTVIHVPDVSMSSTIIMPKARKTVSKKIRNLKRSKKSSLAMSSSNMESCFDCRRSVAQSECNLLCRFCQQCHQTARTLRLVCLECCVNNHNGHKLISIDELARTHQMILQQIPLLKSQILAADLDFQTKLNRACSSSKEFLHDLKAVREDLKTQLTSTINRNDARLRESFLLSPTEYVSIQKFHLTLMTQLQKLNNAFDKINVSYMGQEVYESQTLNEKSIMDSHQRLILGCIDLVSGFSSTEDLQEIKEYQLLLTSNDISVQNRIDLLESCLKVFEVHLTPTISIEVFPLIEDIFFKTFVLINKLNERSIKNRKVRSENWKLVERSYAEILRIGSMNWPSYDEKRIDLVGDLAFLCQLFADVSDSRTITLCAVEAARSRASLNIKKDKNLFKKIKVIEECLLECRRVQKLLNIVKSKSYIADPKCRGFKQFLNCFAPKVL